MVALVLVTNYWYFSIKLQATVTPFLTEHSIESQFVTDTVAQIAIEIRYGGIGAALVWSCSLISNDLKLTIT